MLCRSVSEHCAEFFISMFACSDSKPAAQKQKVSDVLTSVYITSLLPRCPADSSGQVDPLAASHFDLVETLQVFCTLCASMTHHVDSIMCASCGLVKAAVEADRR